MATTDRSYGTPASLLPAWGFSISSDQLQPGTVLQQTHRHTPPDARTMPAKRWSAAAANARQFRQRVLKPTTMKEAMDRFFEMKKRERVNRHRTMRDNRRLFEALVLFTFPNSCSAAEGPNEARAPTRKKRSKEQLWQERQAKRAEVDAAVAAHFVHEFGRSEITAFIEHLAKLPGKHGAAESAPMTQNKKIWALFDLFEYAVARLEAADENPVEPHLESARNLKYRAKQENSGFVPFTDNEIRRIFDPETYLVRTRDPDYFWLPLLGLHWGIRMGELVRTLVSDFRQDPASGLWYVQVRYCKNMNSVRCLPITQPLIDLGFLDLVKKMKDLGQAQLFAHRDYTNITNSNDPSKRCSGNFHKLKKHVGIDDPMVAFRSFRPTVVTGLHDGQVTIADAMAICGHSAQQLAEEKNLITREEGRSVHLCNYMHADRPRLGIGNALQHMKSELERAIRPPLDYTGLRAAADIVLDHVRLEHERPRTGWALQNKGYTAQQISRLHELIGAGRSKAA